MRVTSTVVNERENINTSLNIDKIMKSVYNNYEQLPNIRTSLH